MKKALAFGLSALVLIVLIAGLVIAEIGQTPLWRAELHKYISDRSTALDKEMTVVYTARARRPHLFEAHEGHATWGGGRHFRTDHSYSPRKAYGTTVLPFPPEQVWCVLVQRRHCPGGSLEGHVIFVALHLDLYYAEWIVHEGESEPFSQEFLSILSQVGCDLGLEPRALPERGDQHL